MSEPDASLPVLRAPQAIGTTHTPPAPAVNLPEAIQLANVLSGAGPIIPTGYRDNPGACLAVVLWSQRHDLDPFSAMLAIHQIPTGGSVQVNGRPVPETRPFVSAELRVELANRKGFDILPTHSDSQSCTIEVRHAGELRGSVTVQIDDMPERLFARNSDGTLKQKANGGTRQPTPWDEYPADMLLRAAQRRADKLYCRTGATLVDSYFDLATTGDADADDFAALQIDEPDEPADIIDAEPVEPDPPADAPPEPEATPDSEPEPAPTPGITQQDIRTAAKAAGLSLRQVFADIVNSGLTPEESYDGLPALVANQELAALVVAELERKATPDA